MFILAPIMSHQLNDLLFFPATIRLVNGTDQCSGRVEFYHDEQWFPAYNVGWGMTEAGVVCREMNCGDPLQFSESFGQGRFPRGYKITCSGTESSLTQCTLREYTRTSQDRIEEAAVKCSGIYYILNFRSLLCN